VAGCSCYPDLLDEAFALIRGGSFRSETILTMAKDAIGQRVYECDEIPSPDDPVACEIEAQGVGQGWGNGAAPNDTNDTAAATAIHAGIADYRSALLQQSTSNP